MFVVAGASGNTGSVVATTLLAAGKPVRVIVRDAAKGEAWKQKGAEVAIASFDDPAALGRALTGATGAYVLLPPASWSATGVAAERARTAAAILEGIRAAKPGHVVLLSSIGADLPDGTGPVKYLRPLEAGLRAAGIPSTFLRAGWFMENWAGMAPAAIASGALYYSLAPETKVPHIATPDIGRTAARLLLEGPPPGGVRIVELQGPAEYTLADAAAAIGKAAGKPIQAVSVPGPAMVDAVTKLGASRETAEAYAELADGLNAGKIKWTGTPVRGAVTLEQRLGELIKP